MNIEIIINDEDLDDVMVDNEVLDTNCCSEILEKVKYELENIANREFDRIQIYMQPKTTK